MENRKQ